MMKARTAMRALAMVALLGAALAIAAEAQQHAAVVGEGQAVEDVPGKVKNETEKIVREVEQAIAKYSTVVYAGSIGVGLVVAIVGYKLVDPTLFITVAGVVGFIAFITMNEFIPNTVETKPYVAIGVSLSMAILSGLLIIKLKKIGIVVSGAALGAVGSFWLYTMFLERLHAPSTVPHLYLYIALLLLCPGGAYFAVKIERPTLIVATSVLGSFIAVAGVGHFIGHFPSALDDFKKDGKAMHDPIEWVYLGSFVVMACVTCFIQFKVTAKAEKKDTSADGLLKYSQSDSYYGSRPAAGDATYILVNGNRAVGYA